VADAPEIKVKLTAEDTGVSAAIKELGSQLKSLKKQQDDTASSGFNLSKAFSAIAAAGAVIGFARIGKEAFDSAVGIGKMADKTGLTTQTLSVFHKVADDVGVSTEAVDKALVKGAKSITEFEAGGVAAAKGFKLLNITAKDFAGLKPDEKIALVTDRLGKMQASFAKTTATQLIFSRGGAEMIPVLNALAAEGMDKATAATSKLGLLLDQETTDSFRAAKASIQELEDVGKGMATQFEAGLLPAISDVGEALVDSLTQGGVSFQDLGKYAGDAVRGIAAIFLGLGQTLGVVAASVADVFAAAWHYIKNEAETDFTALGQAAHGHLRDAFNTLNAGAVQSSGIVRDEVERQKAIYKSLGASFKADYANLFPSEAEEKRRAAERLKRLRPEKQDATAGNLQETAPSDAAAKAALSLLEKQLQDELTIHRAYAKQTEQVDAEMYATGEISLAEYFDRRRAAVKADTDEEVAILARGLVEAQAAVEKAAAAKAKAETPKDADKQEAAKAKAETPKDADKQEAARLSALQKVDEFQTKISELQISSSTKISALNDEEFKKKDENQKKLLGFQEQILEAEGKTYDAAVLKIKAEGAAMTEELRKSGGNPADATALTNAKLAAAAFEKQQKSEGEALDANSARRDAVDDKVKTGQLFQFQGDEQLRQVEQDRLTILEQIATQLHARAEMTGAPSDVAAAAGADAAVDHQKANLDQTGQSIAKLKATLQGPLTSGFTNFFQSLVQGTQSVGAAFKGMAASIISSIAQTIAQMYIELMVTKLLKAASGGFSGGGSVGGGGGHAEGGLIKGPGGPKSDSIPARVSAGEYIVKADAVSSFGVQNLEAINRGLKVPSFERLALPKFAEGGLVGNMGAGGGDSNINLGIGLDEGLILKHLSSKAAGNVILQHLTNNPKAASKALSRSD
jgi:hypothetical protein